MQLTRNQMLYCSEMYKSVRFARRGFMFLKPKQEQVNPNTLHGVYGYYDMNHNQGFFSKQDGIVYANFLGSNEISDWFYNVWWPFADTPYKETGTNSEIKIHRGFYHSYLLARDIIDAKIKDASKIVITGHSLGGAVATICALDLQYRYPDKEIGFFVTGSPRVGNAAFVRSFNRRLPDAIRCMHRNDIVPSVPFKSWGFEHIGKLLQLGKRTHGLNVGDHSIKKYTIAIEAGLRM